MSSVIVSLYSVIPVCYTGICMNFKFSLFLAFSFAR